MKKSARNVINDAGRAFFVIQTHLTTQYDQLSLFIISCTFSINDVGRAFFTHFHVLCDGPYLDGKTIAISRAPTIL